MKKRNRMILALISSLAIFGLGLYGLLTNSPADLFSKYIFIIGGGIGAIGSAIEFFKLKEE
ncbi:hypothetical protein [Solibacillus sp. CAU 1738]|uniref:hypothetical protein n=1 Tax=Solibacillus sp. CAU 1738 TaxID=3140363 RepID=UPI0032611184